MELSEREELKLIVGVTDGVTDDVREIVGDWVDVSDELGVKLGVVDGVTVPPPVARTAHGAQKHRSYVMIRESNAGAPCCAMAAARTASMMARAARRG